MTSISETIPASLQAGFGQLPGFFRAGGWLENLELEVGPVTQGPDALVLRKAGGRWAIQYKEPVHFFRALGLLREFASGGAKAKEGDGIQKHAEFVYKEQMHIKEIGVMIDASRNSVPKPGLLRKMVDRMALMGLNRLILYMEDVYQMEGEPRFGYMRGGYTCQELKELDDYADRYGIQVVPSIQVLGHLEKVLRFPEYSHLKDSPSCLLSGSQETYQFIEKMLRTMKACFRSRLVILGMDETHGLGEGRYRALHGGRPPMEIFLEHWRRVEELAKGLGLVPALYSDMLFKYGSSRHAYLDPDMRLEERVKESLPQDSRLIYWDYYSADGKLLEGMMEAHKQFGDSIYAGPLLSVSSFCIPYQATFRVAELALAGVKRQKIPMAYGCLWHDDGAECGDWLGLLGMQYYGEQAYGLEAPSPERLARRFGSCTGLEAKWFLDAGLLDDVPCPNLDNRWPPNASKYLLWQDPLLGLFDADLAGLGLDGHYGKAAHALGQDLEAAGEEGWFLQVPLALAQVLEKKARLSASLVPHYQAKDKEGLAGDLKLLGEIKEGVGRLHGLHRSQWMETCSPFGFDRLDLRYGGLLARLDTALARLGQYLEGSLPSIPELEVPRYFNDRVGDKLGKGIWKIYRNIATLSDEA